ncbi:DUF1566 domain-containing protein [uncultured Thiocystis sp.]|jgi:hypothetical protein|uniref:Lcl C-terminal domain-containing protein n=1 Tax=uncultured Thiocystis sp. TaxID=1202134 RepID=UPI0025DE6D54|nr:DUF1566 domain-containing protein [uncultured Thiocystis sp.]
MHDVPRNKLRELILEYGRSLCDDPRRCEALLRDHCGQHKREIFVLVSALKNRVAEDLLKVPAGVPPSMVLARIGNRLEDELAMTAEAAQWAVESWALALGVSVQPTPVTKPAPVVPSPPPTAPRVQTTPSSAPSGTATALLSGRYRDHGDGTVTDVKTGLQWMRCSLGQEWRGGCCVGGAAKYTWDAARQAAESLNRQNGYVGYRDWRLPTKDELLTLVYCGKPQTWNDTGLPCTGKYKRPTIDPVAFPNTPSSNVWSGSPYASSSSDAWYVAFGYGGVSYYFKDIAAYVRLVRGGQ